MREKYQCPLCGTELTYVQHMVEYGTILSIDKEDGYVSDMDVDDNQYIEHPDNGIACLVCDKKFTTKEILEIING